MLSLSRKVSHVRVKEWSGQPHDEMYEQDTEQYQCQHQQHG
jgi:hypothetical protein